jgi:hypothetical protein
MAKPVIRKGDRVTCPKCGGNHVIVEGTADVGSDRKTAVEDMKTSCGAVLIASQQFYTLGDSPSRHLDGRDRAPPDKSYPWREKISDQSIR